MKFTRYIIIENGNDKRTVYYGGRNKYNQFDTLKFPDKLGKFFDRKSQALKKAKQFNDELIELKCEHLKYYTVARVTIEIEEGIESKFN